MYQSGKRKHLKRTLEFMLHALPFLQIVDNKSHAISQYSIQWHAVEFDSQHRAKVVHPKGDIPMTLQMQLLESEPIPSTIAAFHYPRHFVMVFHDATPEQQSFELCYKNENHPGLAASSKNSITLFLNQDYFSSVALPGKLDPACSSFNTTAGLRYYLKPKSGTTIWGKWEWGNVQLIILEFSKAEYPGASGMPGANPPLPALDSGATGFAMPFPKRSFFPGMPESVGVIDILPLWIPLWTGLNDLLQASPPQTNQSPEPMDLSQLIPMTVGRTGQLTSPLSTIFRETPTSSGATRNSQQPYSSQDGNQEKSNSSDEFSSSQSGDSGSGLPNGQSSDKGNGRDGNDQQPPEPSHENEVDIILSNWQGVVDEFVEAVRANWRKRIYELLEQYGWGLVLSTSSRTGETAIHCAAYSGHFELVFILHSYCPDADKHRLYDTWSSSDKSTTIGELILQNLRNMVEQGVIFPTTDDTGYLTHDPVWSECQETDSASDFSLSDTEKSKLFAVYRKLHPASPSETTARPLSLEPLTPEAMPELLPVQEETQPASDHSSYESAIRPFNPPLEPESIPLQPAMNEAVFAVPQKRLVNPGSGSQREPEAKAQSIQKMRRRASLAGHVYLERKRRKVLREGFHQLKDEVLPKHSCAPKREILKQAKEQIEMMKLQEMAQKEEIAAQKEKAAALTKRIKDLSDRLRRFRE